MNEIYAKFFGPDGWHFQCLACQGEVRDLGPMQGPRERGKFLDPFAPTALERNGGWAW